MSDKAYQVFHEARGQQVIRNDARRIRAKVELARGSAREYGRRWPFELLQNAHDAGSRPGRDSVQVKFEWDGAATLRIHHDGAYFDAQDLAALLSGGSNKEFDAVETTGRFGTGFLSTHVLGCQVKVKGLLLVENAHEQFSLVVDRRGNEPAIVANIDDCDRALRAATVVADTAAIPTATFEYQVDNAEAVEAGLAALADALPYVYGTSTRLGRVEIQTPTSAVTYEPGELWEEPDWSRKRISVMEAGATSTYQVARFPARDELPGALLVLLSNAGGLLEVVVPPERLPRLFVRFPVRGSERLPIPGVVEGRFSIAEERNAVHDCEQNRVLLQGILARVPDAARAATAGMWTKSYELARVAPLPGDATMGLADLGWWSTRLAETAESLARLPIVLSGDRLLPAIASDGDVIDFILAGLSRQSPAGLDHADLLRLATRVRTLCPPVADLSEIWTGIARGWAALGVDVQLLGLEEIGEYARREAQTLAELPVDGTAEEWVAGLVELVGQLQEATRSQLPSLLDGLLPAQDGNLRECRQLERDDGVPERVKDIAARLDIDLRGTLLSTSIEDAATRLGLGQVAHCLATLLPQAVSESDAIERCLHQLDGELPTGKVPRDEAAKFMPVSRDFLRYLAKRAGGDISVLRRCPLGCSDGTVTRVAAGNHVLAPVNAWPAEAQPFAEVYPPQRVLDGKYGEDGLLDELVSAGVVVPEPLVREQAAELRGTRLRAIVHPDDFSETLVLQATPCIQLIDLPTQVMQRCQQDKDRARLLLGLALTYAVKSDNGWQSWTMVQGRRDGTPVQVRFSPSLWLADLLSKAWVPVSSPDGSTQVMQAIQSTLEGLLDPAWLRGNNEAVVLLSSRFGFGELQLRLAAVVSDPAARRGVEGGLAKILELVGGSVDEYERVAQAIENERHRAEEVGKNRKLGLAVQEAVRQALVARGLTVELVDRGFDYAVSGGQTDDPADSSQRFGVGKYLVEVKTTTSGEVRLTPTQARTASEHPEQFVLCVVDLRAVGATAPEEGWTAELVAPHVVLVPGVATAVEEPWEYIQDAKSCTVTVRNDETIRYGVPVAVWEGGLTIAGWIESLGLGDGGNAASPAAQPARGG